MEFDIELGKQLIDELLELWVETKIKCDRIEQLTKTTKRKNKLGSVHLYFLKLFIIISIQEISYLQNYDSHRNHKQQSLMYA